MLGAIIGDIVGSRFEFEPIKTTDFELFHERCTYTDDTVMTVAVAEALMDTYGKPRQEVKTAIVEKMQEWGRKYPDAGYGGRFALWLGADEPQPYNSFGNGSAMRVSAAGHLYGTIRETTDHARYSAEVTHNHPEGIKGAEATAAVIFMLLNGKIKNEAKAYFHGVYGYPTEFTVDEIRPGYGFDVTCQGSVPQAFRCFYEAESFEEALRLSVSLGGDADTLAAIAGSMAEVYFGISEDLKARALTYLPADMQAVINRFYKFKV